MPGSFSRSLASLHADSFRRSRLALFCTGSLLAAWLGWFLLARVTLTQVSLQARLEVNREAHAVQAPVAGRVVKTYLVLGRAVKAGDLIVELDSESQRLSLAVDRAQQAALQQQLAALEKVIAAEEKALKVNLEASEAAVMEAEAQRLEQDVLARYSSDRARRLTRLKQGGHLAELEYLSARTEAEKGSATVDRLAQSVRKLRKTRLASEEDRRAQLARLRQDRTVLMGKVSTAEATTRQLDHDIRQRRIHAPLSGKLAQLAPIRVGSYLEQGSAICTIVPPGAIKAVGYFPPLSMGKVLPGQPARLRLDGFPWTQYGSLRGRVTRVAGELDNGRLRVEILPQPGAAQYIPLQHGLPGTAEVETEHISPAMLLLRTAGGLLSGAPPAPPPGAGGGPPVASGAGGDG